MIKQPTFSVEPWCLRETMLDLDMLAQTESVFALSNGHLGWRGQPGRGRAARRCRARYLNGVYEVRPLPYAEAGYGLPESGQTVINVTNGKLIRLFVDDEPFDVRYGELRSHERHAGLPRGHAAAGRPNGCRRRAGGSASRRTRLVSFTQRAIAAIRYEVEPLDGPARISRAVRAARERAAAADWAAIPGSAAALEHPLTERIPARARGRPCVLVHRTERSGLRVGTAMDHLVEAPDGAGRVPGLRRRRPWSPRPRCCSPGSGCG